MNVQKVNSWSAYVLYALLLIGLPAIVQADDDFESVFIFGDSLSDAGNLYLLTGQVSTAPYLPVPAAPYDIGGHHFTNGKTWAERFAREVERQKGGRKKKGGKKKKGEQNTNGGQPSLKNPGKHGNYAFGGARARSNSGMGAPIALHRSQCTWETSVKRERTLCT